MTLADLCTELELRGWQPIPPCPTRSGDWRTYTCDDGFVRIQPAHAASGVPARLCVRVPDRFRLMEDPDEAAMVAEVRKVLGWPSDVDAAELVAGGVR